MLHGMGYTLSLRVGHEQAIASVRTSVEGLEYPLAVVSVAINEQHAHAPSRGSATTLALQHAWWGALVSVCASERTSLKAIPQPSSLLQTRNT